MKLALLYNGNILGVIGIYENCFPPIGTIVRLPMSDVNRDYLLGMFDKIEFANPKADCAVGMQSPHSPDFKKIKANIRKSSWLTLQIKQYTIDVPIGFDMVDDTTVGYNKMFADVGIYTVFYEDLDG